MRDLITLVAGALIVIAVICGFSIYANHRLPQDKENPAGLVEGNPAPDFEGDFAVNGTPVKLSSLKGKVVLVDFWAVWCGPCISTFPHLREWNKEFKSQGLEIVGLTRYNYESGEFFGFDKEKGKLTQAESADKSSEQAMLKDFAKHHKLDHLLMTLPGAEANKTWRDYEVRGIPRVILIDRKGIVRLIKIGADRVGGDQEIAREIENEIKTLLAEKA